MELSELKEMKAGEKIILARSLEAATIIHADAKGILLEYAGSHQYRGYICFNSFPVWIAWRRTISFNETLHNANSRGWNLQVAQSEDQSDIFTDTYVDVLGKTISASGTFSRKQI